MNELFDQVKQLPKDYRYILDCIQKEGPISKSSLLEQSKIKMTKLNRILEQLMQLNLVVQQGNGNSTGGRRPLLFDVQREKFYMLSLAIGTIRYTLSVVNCKMEVLTRVSGAVPFAVTAENFLDYLVTKTEQLMMAQGLSKDDILGMGVATFGHLDREEGVIHREVSFNANDTWVGFPLKERLENRLGLTVSIDMGANAETMNHFFYGQGRGAQRMVSVICGVSIRTGVIINGQLVRKDTTPHDALGHMTVNMDGRRCKCGNYGCVECYSSLSAIRNSFFAQLKMGRTSSIQVNDENELTVEHLEEAAQQGDALTLELFSMGAAALGCGIINYINLFNPDVVVLSGIMLEKSSVYYEKVSAVIHQRLSYLNVGSKVAVVRYDQRQDLFAIQGATLFWEEWISGD